MHSMPRTFLVRRGEPTSGRNDSYQPGNRKHCLSDAVAETGDSMMPGTRIFEQVNIRQGNSTQRTTRVMKPLQERNHSNKQDYPKTLKPGVADSHQSSLDILATAAAQCAPSENTDLHDHDINSEDGVTDTENIPLNPHQKLPSFATLAYNIARQERENLNIPRSRNMSASSQSSLVADRTKKSPRKNAAKYTQSVTQGKENIPTSTNGKSRLAQMPFRETLNVLTQVKHNTNVRDASPSDATNGIPVTTTEAASVRVNKHSSKSPSKEVKTAVKPKIWNPIFHEYTPKKELSKTDVKVKTEPVSDSPGETSSNSNTVSYGSDVKKSVASERNLIKHSVESMIKKDLPSSDNHNTITGDLTIKRLLPKHEEEPTAKKIKLDENIVPTTPQTTNPLTETKIPSKFPIAIQEFPLYKISATPPISPYFSRGFEPSPKTFADVALRPLMPNMQLRTFSPFSPSFGRADNVIATEMHKSPPQVTCKIASMSSQNMLDTPLKQSVAPVRVYASTPMTSSLRESPMFRPTDSVFKMETKPSVTRVLAPTFKDSENLPLTNEVEVVNGGFGIKNPSYRAPKPSDITNIQPDSETGKGKYECKICSKAFGLQRLLNRHLKCHSDVKRYLCTFCGKGFNDTFDLKRHTRIHTGVKPYSCSECDRSFTQRCSLESHCRKVHNMDINYAYKQRRNKIYVCEECGHSTPNTSKHFVHLRENHPNNPALTKCHDRRQFKFSMENQQNVHLPRT